MNPFAPFQICGRLLLASVAIAPCFVEEVEINRVTREDGEERFVQTVTWAKTDSSCQHVAWWEMTNEHDTMVFRDGGVTLIRSKLDCHPAVIRAWRVKFSETAWDVEEFDRDVLPVEERMGLR